jgi:hypothetical protein
VEHRDLLGLRAPDRARGNGDKALRRGAQHVALEPRGKAGGVELRRIARQPRRLRVDAARYPVELAQPPGDVDERQGVEAGDRAPVSAQAAIQQEQVVALAVRRKRLHADIAGERGDPVLRRTDPLAAHLEHLSAADGGVQRPPADAVPSLEDHDVCAARGEVARGSESGKAGSDYDHVGRAIHGSKLLLWRVARNGRADR